MSKRADPDEPEAPAPRAAPAPRFVLEKGSEVLLDMLEAMGCSRAESLASLAERASERLVMAVPDMQPNRVTRLVSDTFPHIESPLLQAAAIAALERTPELPEDVVTALRGPQRALLDALPLRVRQRVWETEQPPTLFLEATHSTVIELLKQGALRFERAALREAAEVAPKQRRAEDSVLQRLISLLGSSSLYVALVNLCKEIHANMGDAAAGALRSDILLALHELDDVARPVARWDATHMFVCCVDAALREQSLEARSQHILMSHATAAGLPPIPGEALSTDTLMGSAASISPGFVDLVARAAHPTAVLIELAMILSQPPCVQLLVETLLNRVEEVVERGALPGSDSHVRTLVPLLTLAVKAPSFAKVGGSGFPAAEKWQQLMSMLLHRALPVVAELIVDDHIKDHAHRHKMLEKGHGLHLVLLYALRRVEAADEARVEQMLPLIAALGNKLDAHKDFAGGLVSVLIADPRKRLTPRIARAAVAGCLVPLSAVLPHAHLQLLRLMHSQWQLLGSIPADDVADGAKSVDGILRTAKADGLMLLQAAAQEARQRGAQTDDGSIDRAYAKLAKLAPGVLGDVASPRKKTS